MYNPLIMDLLASEQIRRDQEEIRQIQLLNEVDNPPQGYIHLLRSWITRFPKKHNDKKTTDNDSSRIPLPHHG